MIISLSNYKLCSFVNFKTRGEGRSVKTRKFQNKIKWKIMRSRVMSLGAYI